MAYDLPQSTSDVIEKAARASIARFGDVLKRKRPELPPGSKVMLLPMAIVHQAETGGIHIQIGGSVPLAVAAEALRIALASVEKILDTSDN